MAAVGLRPIVEVQFADYIWPGLNQLFTELSRSFYLSNGKWPASMILRVPIGAYGSGGPFHSSSVESVVANIKGVKIAYPSNGADLKGLLKSAYYDPNPVVIFEHKGLYWSKVPGTQAARTVTPDRDYVIPFGKGRMVLEAEEEKQKEKASLLIVTYGMGVHWALNAAKDFDGQVSILDLRTLAPLDMELVYEEVRKHGKCLVVTEEAVNCTLAQSIAARIQENCFTYLDGPVRTIGSADLPAICLNEILEKSMLLSAAKLSLSISDLLKY
jgi:2-oxoisovalerate dehydrogenase E1 component